MNLQSVGAEVQWESKVVAKRLVLPSSPSINQNGGGYDKEDTRAI
jgi:hypothetical protein